MVEKKKRKARAGTRQERTESAQQGQPQHGGVAGDVLQGLGDIVPGLGKILKGLEKSTVFQERLETINQELGHRLSGIPGKSIIPEVKGSVSLRSLAGDQPAFEVKADKFKKSAARKTASSRPSVEPEVQVDFFEDATHLKIIAELPGVTQKDVKVELRKSSLVISADIPNRSYYKEVVLPCPVKGEPRISGKNGVLEIDLEKAD